MPITLNRVKLLDQIKYDPMKALALFEKVIVAFLTILVAFYLLRVFGLVRELLIGPIGSGTLGFLAVMGKKMYYDNAFSNLELSGELLDSIESSLFQMGYRKNGSGVFMRDTRKFSIFHQCKSENIHIEPGRGKISVSGPHEDLQNLYNIVCR